LFTRRRYNIDELIPEDAAAADNIEIVTRIASNNVEAGRLQAQLLLKSLSQGAKVAIIEGDPGTTSSRDRVTGFASAAKEGGLTVIASQPPIGTGRRLTSSQTQS
jgi:ABC-type sugar transport system substrate-binding protein